MMRSEITAAFVTLRSRNIYDDKCMRAIEILEKELRASDKLREENICHHVNKEITEAKIAALKEAIKRLAEDLDRREAKLNILVEKIGEERIRKLLEADAYEKAAKLLEKMSEEARKEGEKEGAEG